jgi:hypothetical protein
MMSPQEKSPSVAEASKRTGLPAPVVLVLAHLDALAFGVALGLVAGLSVSSATVVLLIKGGPNVGANLGLLSQYFIGYRVSLVGAMLGFLYASMGGFVLGYAFAWTRNYMVRTYLTYIRRRAEQQVVSDLLDRMT